MQPLSERFRSHNHKIYRTNLFATPERGNVRRACAGIAQLVEQLICNQQVVGSNPTAGSSVACQPFVRAVRDSSAATKIESSLESWLSRTNLSVLQQTVSHSADGVARARISGPSGSTKRNRSATG
jgi:hypothetical protein